MFSGRMYTAHFPFVGHCAEIAAGRDQQTRTGMARFARRTLRGGLNKAKNPRKFLLLVFVL